MDKTTFKQVRSRQQKSKKAGVTIKYDNCCKACWHTWKTYVSPKHCPKCKAGFDYVDIKKEICI